MTDTISETQSLLHKLKSLTAPCNKPPYIETAKAILHESKYVQETPTSEYTTKVDMGFGITNTNHKIPSVPFELWETLAYDIALSNTDFDTIANSYDITTEQLNQLHDNPYFSKILQAKKDEVKQLGADAAFAVKMRMVANRATPQLLRRLIDPSTANRDFLAMFKTVTELGQLIPQSSQDDTTQPTLIGASVTFNIGGVPGLEHLVRANKAEVGDNTVTDVDWQEVITSRTGEVYHDELGEL